MAWIRTGAAALCAACVVAALTLTPAAAEGPPRPAPTATIAVGALPAPAVETLDVEKATNAYLSQIKGEARAKSDAYFEGGYWLILVDTLYTLAIAGILLFTRLSAGMRNVAAGITRSRFFQVPIYVALYTVVTAVLAFPLEVYERFFREHAFGLSNQTFAQWFGEYGIIFGLQLIGSMIILSIIYSVIRATPRNWWLWGTGVMTVFMIIGVTIAPVFILPLLNKYTPMQASPLKSEIVSLARANGIPAKDIYVSDASKQSKRISANVSGFAGTTRITLNDNLLHRSTPREIKAVMAHEMGHYVLNHSVIGLTWQSLLILAGFAFVAWGFGAMTELFGGFWDVRDITDPAGFPLIMALFAVFTFFATPVQNTMTRTLEIQADIFGLNAARQPDGFANAALQLSEYRKLDPGKWEEIIFYDHPSGRNRIHMSMQWKAEHLHDPDIVAGPKSPQ